MKLETKEVIQKQAGTEREDIHIGLVLAGAVTAGAYTAGVLDYLLNTLDLWYEKHAEDPKNVAKPNVIIDAITGASAGSIVAAVTLMALATKRYKNVDDPTNLESDKNLLFDTWVNLGLPRHESMTNKLFATSDLENGHVKSMLNTNFIGDMIDKLTTEWKVTDVQPMPAYIKSDLKVLMTLSNLRGVPLELSFSSGNGAIAHTMSYHKAFAYFTLDKKDKDPTTFSLDLKKIEDVKLMLHCSRASGAFPIGLKSVPFKEISKEYIEANLAQIFKGANIKPRIEEPYQFLAVDGGMTNNEPIAEAFRILNPKPESPPLEQRVSDILKNGKEQGLSAEEQLANIDNTLKEEKRSNKPIIMIDPFPNFSFPEGENATLSEKELEEKYLNDGLVHVIPRLYDTLRNQVLFKESDIADLFSNDSQKGMIWPTRYKDGKKYRNAIASGALGGFAGFFRREFLEHDYMLAQKNCQRFLRNYFYQDYDQSGWPQVMKDKFAYVSDEGKQSLPIIPDYKVESYDATKKLFLPEIQVGDFPKVSYEDLILSDLRPKIARRVTAIMDKLEEEMKKKKEPDHSSKNANTITAEHPWLLKSKPFNEWLRNSLLGDLVIKILVWAAKKWLKGQVNRWITNQIILDMSRHGLFRNDENEPDNVLR